MRLPAINTIRTTFRVAFSAAVIAGLLAPAGAEAAQREGITDACKLKYTFTAPNMDEFRNDTTTMIAEIRNRFATISEEAASLQVYADSPSVPSKTLHETKLTELKSAANEVAEEVCKLRARKYLASRWQRDITEELAASANTLNLHVANAIEHLNDAATSEELFFTQYDENIDAIYEISSRLERRTEQFLNYGEWKKNQS